MFSFIFLITAQLFLLTFWAKIEFWHSGLNNISILKYTTVSFLTGILVVVLFYNFSVIKIFMELKSPYK